MGYFKAYWQQVKALYKQLWILMFAKERNLEGKLSDFVMRPGFLWQLLMLHWYMLVAIGRFITAIFSLLLGYLTFFVMIIVFILLPAILFFLFPIFSFKRYRHIKAQAGRL